MLTGEHTIVPPVAYWGQSVAAHCSGHRFLEQAPLLVGQRVVFTLPTRGSQPSSEPGNSPSDVLKKSTVGHHRGNSSPLPSPGGRRRSSGVTWCTFFAWRL